VAEEAVIADASPLIGLAATGRFQLLRDLFGRLTVTVSVRREVLAGKTLPGAAELRSAIRAGWISVARDSAGAADFPELGRGEAATLPLALARRGASLVLMDDPHGRARAQAAGLAVIGLAGVLLAAKQAHLVPAVKPLLIQAQTCGFRLSRELVRTVLSEAGEA